MKGERDMSKERKKKKKGGCLGTILKVFLIIVLVVVVLFAALIIRNNQSTDGETEAEKNTEASYIIEDTENIETEQATEIQTEAVAASSVSSDEELVNGMRPSFKAAMDSYEEFFDEYCEFMTTYAESDNAIAMLADYMNFMTQYSETMEAMDALGEEEMNDIESAYYAEVNLRISQKLLEVATAE